MSETNCRERCPYKDLCKRIYHKFNGENGLHHSECPMAWKIEDALNDARDIEEELSDGLQE